METLKNEADLRTHGECAGARAPSLCAAQAALARSAALARACGPLRSCCSVRQSRSSCFAGMEKLVLILLPSLLKQSVSQAVEVKWRSGGSSGRGETFCALFLQF